MENTLTQHQKERLFPSTEELNTKRTSVIENIQEDVLLFEKIFDEGVIFVKNYIKNNISDVLEDYKEDSYKRLAAEFQNYKNRTLKEKSEIIKTGSKSVILEILSVIDDFERATDLSEGMELIYKKMLKILENNSCKEMIVINEIFNPETMEAITSLENEDMKNRVIDVIQKGYTINDIIIRYPKVVIGI